MLLNFDNFEKLARIPDRNALMIYFTGGIRAGTIAKGIWMVEPILENGYPCAAGPLTSEQLNAFAVENKIHAIAFHNIFWTKGDYNSSWAPIIPHKANHREGPTQLWSNVASNISRPRIKQLFDGTDQVSEEEIVDILDTKGPVEALARNISLSLRSMDISMEQIAGFYNEQLTNGMAAGNLNGERFNNTQSQTLNAHVHSFFLHFGATRDYLAALIAHRIGLDHTKDDSLARMVDKLRQDSLPKDELLELLIRQGDISPHPEKPSKFVISGWMRDATEVRNELVHNRPYGSKHHERSGRLVPLQGRIGLFRYFRPFAIGKATEVDLLDVLQFHYSKCSSLMYDAVKASGYDTAITHLTDDDVIS